MTDTKRRIEELRDLMGTLPSQEVPLQTNFLKGVEGITVDMIDWPVNPYKAMYVLATTCWNKPVNKWGKTSPENRFGVVKAVLERNALPLALEAPKFTFVIEGPSRAAFDQFARTRVGVVFSAKGMRDNSWSDCDIRIPTALWDKPYLLESVIETMDDVKNVYHFIVTQGKGSWQLARTVLPLYVVYGWSESITYASLMGVCANRMKACEMEDVVATAWLMAKAVSDRFPLLGSRLRPGCDFGGTCQYHKSYHMSEMFGCLFKECGRNPVSGGTSNGYAEFNETCTNYKDLEEQLGIPITKPNEWPNFETYESLDPKDKALFEAE